MFFEECCKPVPLGDGEDGGPEISLGAEFQTNTAFSEATATVGVVADDTDVKSIEAALADNNLARWGPVHENSTSDLGWMNHLLSHLWPEMEQAMQYIMDHRVLPKIKEKALLKSEQIHDVRLSEFNLGRLPPNIKRIQSSHLPDGVSRVQCWGEYTSDMVVEMQVDTSLGTFKCGIKNLTIEGDMVFFLRPFEESMPGTGSVSAFFMEVPSINFNFLGHSGIIENLGVKDIILSAMTSALEKLIVLPNIVTINVGLTDFKVYPLVFEKPEPIGILRITLLKAAMGEDEKAKEVHKKKGFSIRKRIEATADMVFEYFDTRLGKAMGKDMSNYLGFRIGDEMWKPKVSMKDVTHDFPVVDTEQKLLVDVWDPDYANADDEIGTVAPVKITEAVTLTGRVLRLLDSDGQQVATAQVKTEWLNVERQAVGQTDSMVIFSVRELSRIGGGLAGCRLVLQGRIGQKVAKTAPGAILKDRRELPVVMEVLEDIERKLQERGVAEDIIKDVVDLQIMKTRVSINSAVFLCLESKDIETAQLELSVIDLQKKKDAKGRPIAGEHEEVLAEHNIPMKKLRSSQGMHIPGPITMKGTGSLDDFEVEFDLTLCALNPGHPTEMGSKEQAPRLSTKKQPTR